MPLRIVLMEPEIPQNTGNIGRLAVALDAELWLVGKLGFSLEEKRIRRSGMDYWENLKLTVIPDLNEFYPHIDDNTAFISTKGTKFYTEIPATATTLIFGNESSGLPMELYDHHPEKLYRLPMREGIRSINLASSAAVVAYHQMALNGFPGLI